MISLTEHFSSLMQQSATKISAKDIISLLTTLFMKEIADLILGRNRWIGENNPLAWGSLQVFGFCVMGLPWRTQCDTLVQCQCLTLPFYSVRSSFGSLRRALWRGRSLGYDIIRHSWARRQLKAQEKCLAVAMFCNKQCSLVGLDVGTWHLWTINRDKLVHNLAVFKFIQSCDASTFIFAHHKRSTT